jgi:outer membrane protein assembly factor BamB
MGGQKPTRRQWLAVCGTAATALSGCTLLPDGLGRGHSDDSESTAWPMVGNGPTHTGHAPTASLSTGSLNEQWSGDLGKPPYTSPVVAGGQVFVASNDYGIRAFDLSGTAQWIQPSIGTYLSTPAVNKSTTTLFVPEDTRAGQQGQEDGAFLRALDTATGNEQWRTQLGGTDTAVFAPTVANDTIYLRTSSELVVLNAVDGSVRWKHPSPKMPSFSSGPLMDLSPAVTDGMVYVPDADGLSAIDSDDQSVIWEAKTGKVRATPAVADSTVYLADVSSGVHALDADTGTEQWTWGSLSRNTLSIADGRVYTTSGLDVIALNASDGDVEWRTGDYGLHGSIYSSVAVGDGFLATGSLGYGITVIVPGGGWFSDEIRWYSGVATYSSPAIANNSLYAVMRPTPSKHGGLYVYK